MLNLLIFLVVMFLLSLPNVDRLGQQEHEMERKKDLEEKPE